ncbi:Hypothetical protein MLEA_000600 [Mycoplasma leachii 99/014/6]|nr:Hypothetical protein MLEA_000600 [Mycoplasma leachii 99/014/6]
MLEDIFISILDKNLLDNLFGFVSEPIEEEIKFNKVSSISLSL